MGYEFACGDVVDGCAAKVSAESEEDLMRQVQEHAAAEHGITDVTPELAEQVRGKVRQV